MKSRREQHWSRLYAKGHLTVVDWAELATELDRMLDECEEFLAANEQYFLEPANREAEELARDIARGKD